MPFTSLGLGDDLLAAVADQGYHEGQMLAVGGHTVGDLGGQLPGWGQYQGAYLVMAGGLAGAQALQQGQGKTGRLAGAGLGVACWICINRTR